MGTCKSGDPTFPRDYIQICFKILEIVDRGSSLEKYRVCSQKDRRRCLFLLYVVMGK